MTIRRGAVGSGSIFSRSRRMCTVTVEVSPKVQPHTCASSCSRLNAWRGLAHEEHQEVVLPGGQGQRALAQHDRVRAQVDDEVAVLDDAQRWWVGQAPAPGAAQHRPDPQGQLAGAEWLGDVIVGTGLEADHPIGLLAQRGQHHDGDGPLRAQSPAHFQAVDAGQHQVQDDQVRRLGGDPAQSLVAVANAFHMVPIARQVTPDDISQGRVIIDHDDASRPVGVGIHPYTVDGSWPLCP